MQIKYGTPDYVFNKLLMILSIISYLLIVFEYIYPLFAISILTIVRIGRQLFYCLIVLKMIIYSSLYILLSAFVDSLLVGKIEGGYLFVEISFNILLLSILWVVNKKKDKDILIALVCIIIFRIFIM